jgi:hypothetical protein
MEPWSPSDGGVGGSDTAASGIPEAYVIRLDRIVEMTLRIEEDELPGYRDFLNWARASGQAFFIRLDKDDESTEFEAYLQFPRWEDQPQVSYSRLSEFPTVFTTDLHVRRRYGNAITVEWKEANT